MWGVQKRPIVLRIYIQTVLWSSLWPRWSICDDRGWHCWANLTSPSSSPHALCAPSKVFHKALTFWKHTLKAWKRDKSRVTESKGPASYLKKQGNTKITSPWKSIIKVFVRNDQQQNLCFVQRPPPPWGFLWRSHWRANQSLRREKVAQSVACWGNEALKKWQCYCMQP